MPNDKLFDDVNFDDALDKTEEEILEEEKRQEEEEKQRQKNKDAEEARKRREAEEKEKAEAEAKKLAEEKELEAQRLADEEQKAKEKETTKKVEKEKKLGEQLSDFKDKYPDIDLAKLDEDKQFKTFIDGKLLGKDDFISLYEKFTEMKTGLTGRSKEEEELRYKIKEESSSGSQQTQAEGTSDVYSEQEMADIMERAKFMSPNEYAKVQEKFNRSIAFYEKTK